jgi:hypothetical protein
MRDEPCLAADVIALQHYCGLNLRVFQQKVLDLLEFDPVTANLHLLVEAAKAFKRPVGAAKA